MIGRVEMPAILEVQRLEKRFGGVVALAGVDLTVNEGEILGIIGPNGSGKTTLFNVITGVHRPTSGHVSWLGEDITAKAPHVVAKKGIGRTFQQAMAFSALSIAENVRIACQHSRKREDGANGGLTTPTEILDFVELSHLAGEGAANLGFGNLRKLGLAIALGSQPRLLLADEPAAGLNDRETADLATLIRAISARHITVAVIDHDMKLMMTLCERLIVLDFGYKIKEGPPEEVRNDPKVLEVYLGGDVELTGN